MNDYDHILHFSSWQNVTPLTPVGQTDIRLIMGVGPRFNKRKLTWWTAADQQEVSNIRCLLSQKRRYCLRINSPEGDWLNVTTNSQLHNFPVTTSLRVTYFTVANMTVAKWMNISSVLIFLKFTYLLQFKHKEKSNNWNNYQGHAIRSTNTVFDCPISFVSKYLQLLSNGLIALCVILDPSKVDSIE